MCSAHWGAICIQAKFCWKTTRQGSWGRHRQGGPSLPRSSNRSLWFELHPFLVAEWPWPNNSKKYCIVLGVIPTMTFQDVYLDIYSLHSDNLPDIYFLMAESHFIQSPLISMKRAISSTKRSGFIARNDYKMHALFFLNSPSWRPPPPINSNLRLWLCGI